MKRITIIGATGYIGKSLVAEFNLEDGAYQLSLFSRAKSKADKLVADLNLNQLYNQTYQLDDFLNVNHDVIINCSGGNTIASARENPSSILDSTELVDNLIIDYLKNNPSSLYINLSSGAVFGVSSNDIVSDQSLASFNINDLKASEFYGISKLYTETKHRALDELSIVDLRIFSFFSRFASFEEKYLLAEIIQSLKNNTTFETNDVDIERDYITPTDLIAMIKILMEQKFVNDVYDMYSAEKITKLKLINFFCDTYGLKFSINPKLEISNSLSKNVYYSESRKAKKLGYEPQFSSLEGIKNEIDLMYKLSILE